MKRTMNWIYSKKIVLLGILLGVSVGYLYYLYFGCTEKACPITANPYKTSGLFGLMGALLGAEFQTKQLKK